MNLLSRMIPGSRATRENDVPCVTSVTVLPSANGTGLSADEKATSIARAHAMGVDYVRTTSELYKIAPNRATRTWTYIDENLDVIADYGLGVQLELTEGPDSGDWDCSNRKTYVDFSTADRPYWEALLFDIVTRAISKVGRDKIAISLLNEPDNAVFNEDVDEIFIPMHMNIMDWMATFVKSNFPDIPLIGSSLSIFDNASMTWPVISNTYFGTGTLRPVWSLIDYFDFHIYPNGVDRRPPPGPNEVFHFTRQMINGGIAQLLALNGGHIFDNVRYLTTETNRTYNNGQNTSPWSYGSEGTLAELFSAQLDALQFDERVWMASVYNVRNRESGFDDRSSASNHGLYRYTEATTKRLQRFTLKNGKAFDDSAVTASDI